MLQLWIDLFDHALQEQLIGKRSKYIDISRF